MLYYGYKEKIVINNNNNNNNNNNILEGIVKDTLKAFDELKTTTEVYEIMFFWCVKVCIFWKCIQYTIHWAKTQVLRKFPWGKINGTKNAFFPFVSSDS